jgi:hypothetical protein
MLKNAFETAFREFVPEIGGQLIPTTPGAHSADFLFPQDDVIAELKTLLEDARREYDTKMRFLVHDWQRRGLILAYGTVIISLRELNPICQREWIDVLQPPIENIVKDANRQIRSSKQTLGREYAKGVLVIANDGNLLHTRPLDYMRLVGIVLRKKTPSGEPRFPHIHGIVYLSYRIPSAAEKLPFWVDGTVNDPARETALCNFHSKLRLGWYDYVSQITGMPVVERQSAK